MYYSKQLQQQPSFTYLSLHPTNPNPNSHLPYHQTVLQSAEPALHPPGTDPYANSASYPLTHTGYAGQNQYYEDPNAGSSIWGSSLSADLSSSGSSFWTNQSLVNNVATNQSVQNVQPFRCEICSIDCNSKDVFEKHISGRKHLKKLQNHLNSSAPGLQTLYGTAINSSLSSQIGSATGQVVSREMLEIKKQNILNSGAPVDSVRVCTVCNVACNSQEVFIKHLSGKKHAAQATLMSLGGGVGQQFAAIKAQNNNFWSKGTKKTRIVQSSWCQVCKLSCNSQDAYFKHLQGKKHQKNLENLSNPNNGNTATPSISASTSLNQLIGPVENPDGSNKDTSVDSQKRSKSTVEDVETKKRKVVESGAAAGAVRVCSICNVVCNSETVFSVHLAGQKHAAMVKKQAEGKS